MRPSVSSAASTSQIRACDSGLERLSARNDRPGAKLQTASRLNDELAHRELRCAASFRAQPSSASVEILRRVTQTVRDPIASLEDLGAC